MMIGLEKKVICTYYLVMGMKQMDGSPATNVSIFPN